MGPGYIGRKIPGYVDESFLEMFDEWSSTKHILFVQTLNLIGCHDNHKAEFAKNIKKSTQKLYGRLS